jgi:hypothetical protein
LSVHPLSLCDWLEEIPYNIISELPVIDGRISFDWKTASCRKYTPSELCIENLTTDLHVLDILPAEPSHRISVLVLVCNTCSEESHTLHKSHVLQDRLWPPHIRSDRKRSSISRTLPLSYTHAQREVKLLRFQAHPPACGYERVSISSTRSRSHLAGGIVTALRLWTRRKADSWLVIMDCFLYRHTHSGL